MKTTPRIMAATTLALSSVFATNAAAHDIPERLRAIHDNAHEICTPVGPATAANERTAKLRQIISVLDQSPAGHIMLEEARNYDDGKQVWVCFEDRIETGAQYYPNQGVIGMSTHDSFDVSVWNLAHETRHFWQEQHVNTSPDGLSLSDQIALSHSVEADAEAIAITALWELKEQGMTGPWDAHNDPAVCKNVCYTDISAAFATAIAEGRDTASGIPQARAYSQWFADATRTEEYAWDAALIYLVKTKDGDVDISLDEIDTTPSPALEKRLSDMYRHPGNQNFYRRPSTNRPSAIF